MAGLEVVSNEYIYEAGLTFVSPEHGFHDHIFRSLSAPTVEAVQQMPLDEFERDLLGIVDITRTAMLQVRHDAKDPQFGVNRSHNSLFPLENIRGQRQFAHDRLLVTDNTGASLTFMKVSEIISSGAVPPYTAKWLGKLAQGNLWRNSLPTIQQLMAQC